MCLLEDSQAVCYCVPDYHGQLCEMRYNDCESKFARCENGGTCIDGINNFTCSCPPPYGGDMCLDYFPLPTIDTTIYKPTIPIQLHTNTNIPTSTTIGYTHTNISPVTERHFAETIVNDKPTTPTQLITRDIYTTTDDGKIMTATETTTKNVFQMSETTNVTTQFFTTTEASQITVPATTIETIFTVKDAPSTETTKDSRSSETITMNDSDKTTTMFTTVPTSMQSYDVTQIILSTSSTVDLLPGIITTLGDDVIITKNQQTSTVSTTVQYSSDNCTGVDCPRTVTPWPCSSNTTDVSYN